ncbi:hypothetical protein J2W49_001189 [Hydrogenophaga palleronii]|uniref:Transposase zinc-ribbon domain-containing protein n=1 Tax=Hydrogenophaga palleronii TaxID=65655 RepID=A0ABU1WIZ0_9BURK|nr:hypothetical protein [Hydrogenophaga palleronii]
MSRGGSRWGAGRPATRAKAENMQRIDVREWARRGYLKRAATFTWSWRCGTEPAGSIGVSVSSPNHLTLRYTVTENGERRDVAQRVELPMTACPYGGARQWFACPRCGRRVALLYLRWGRFACRTCQRIAYASQSEDEMDRLWRKQSRLSALLGDHWRRPKGMRQRTYKHILAGVMDCEQLREEALSSLMARLLLA